jgi:hypothetical protein
MQINTFLVIFQVWHANKLPKIIKSLMIFNETSGRFSRNMLNPIPVVMLGRLAVQI